jgi:uncharacterized protein (TIGR02284 family)
MITTIGKNESLNETLSKLIKLDYEAVEAYEESIERVDDIEVKRAFSGMRDDHVRHTRELSQILRERGETPPDSAGAKGFITKGKVIFADLSGDEAILKAMRTNEDDTNTAYENALANHELTPDIRAILQKNRQDEARHCSWIISRIHEKEAEAA